MGDKVLLSPPKGMEKMGNFGPYEITEFSPTETSVHLRNLMSNKVETQVPIERLIQLDFDWETCDVNKMTVRYPSKKQKVDLYTH